MQTQNPAWPDRVFWIMSEALAIVLFCQDYAEYLPQSARKGHAMAPPGLILCVAFLFLLCGVSDDPQKIRSPQDRGF